MIKITTTDSLEILLSKDAIKEIVPAEDQENCVIHTANNRYLIRKSEVSRIIDKMHDDSIEHLIKAIRDLYTLLRARLH